MSTHGALCVSGILIATLSVLAQPSGRRMALTFDDLPYVDSRAQTPAGLAAARRVTETILGVLAAHAAPATGFVNEGKLAGPDREARIALLHRWVDAGAVLGNHTYSHPDLNAVTVEAFQQEILDGEVVTRRLMKPREPYPLFFRHPQTHTGDTQAKKDAIDRFLAARGYTVAPHTVETSDYVYQRPYAAARRAGDTAAAGRLREAYLAFALDAVAFAERIAPEIVGREIPQTLLVHANDITADTLDVLLRRLEARGYRFVTLESAMEDAAYRTPDTLVSRSGPTWLWRWRESLGLTVSFRGDPEVPQWVLDLFDASR
jgi:peptidoglycan/xylan/chitin deacetylase (PgdA/CDA1 family)